MTLDLNHFINVTASQVIDTMAKCRLRALNKRSSGHWTNLRVDCTPKTLCSNDGPPFLSLRVSSANHTWLDHGQSRNESFTKVET